MLTAARRQERKCQTLTLQFPWHRRPPVDRRRLLQFIITPPQPTYREFVDHMTVLQTFNNPFNHSSSCESTGCPFIPTQFSFTAARSVCDRLHCALHVLATKVSITRRADTRSHPGTHYSRLYPPPCDSLQLGHLLRRARGGVGGAAQPVLTRSGRGRRAEIFSPHNSEASGAH